MDSLKLYSICHRDEGLWIGLHVHRLTINTTRNLRPPLATPFPFLGASPDTIENSVVLRRGISTVAPHLVLPLEYALEPGTLENSALRAHVYSRLYFRPQCTPRGRTLSCRFVCLSVFVPLHLRRIPRNWAAVRLADTA